MDGADVGLLREREDVAAKLGHAEAGVDDRPEAIDRGPQHLDRHGRGAVADAREAREVVLADLRVLEEEVDHRGGEASSRHLMPVDQAHPELRFVRTHEDEEPASGVRDRHDVAGDVAERERHQDPFVSGGLVLDNRLERGGDEVAVGEHRPLREAGRAARVDQPCGVVFVDLDRWLGRLGRSDEVVV